MRNRMARMLVVAVAGLTVAGLVAPAAAPAALAAPSVPGARRAPAQAAGDVPDLGALGWQPVLDEDFEGTRLDESLWSVRAGPGTSGPGLRTRDAVQVGGDELTLRVYTEGGTHYSGEVALGELGGSLGFAGTYGYVESRIRIQMRPSTRAAFWSLSPTWHKSPFGDPAAAGPEIDIMEVFTRWPEQINAGKHWDGFDEDHKRDVRLVENPTSTPIQGNYHVYGLLWTPDGYRIYVDGIEIYRSTEAVTYSPEFFILSLMQGTDPSETPDTYGPRGAPENASLRVDYVRMWQRPVSEVPDQTVAANRPVAIPFSVQDHAYSSAERPEPGSVRVSASVVSGADVVPADNVVVGGNGAADPDGSFANPGFQPDLSGWNPSGRATAWDTRRHSGSHALRLTQGGGRVSQTVTGLQPGTTYVVGGWYNLDLGYTDANGDGRVTWNGDADGDGRPDPDEVERFTEAGDWVATADWGVEDFDGDRDVRATLTRNGLTDAGDRWWAVADGEWRQDTLVFTTGPFATQATLFVDNTAYGGGTADSDLSFDDIWIQPLVPPDRTVTVRPAADRSGPATIRLTATDAAGRTIGTEDFTLTFTRGSSFTNGDFEATPLGAGWDLVDNAPGRGAAVVVENPFRLDRALELANGERGTAVQSVTGLTPGASYTLEVTGRVSAAGGDMTLAVGNYGGAPLSDRIETTSWATRRITFTPTSTTADILLYDWDRDDGTSLVDDVRLTTTSPSAGFPPAPGTPALTSIGEQRLRSSAPRALAFELPAAAQVTGVVAWTPWLLPRQNVAVGGRGATRVLGLTPVADRTGEAYVSVNYSDATGAHTHTFPVVVSDHRLTNPGFEDGRAGWSSGATVVDAGARTGAGVLRLDGATPVSQHVTWLPWNTTFTVGGWGRAGARMVVRRGGVDVGSVDWTGTGWSERMVTFTMTPCAECFPNGTVRSGQPLEDVQIVLQDLNPGDGAPAFVDDLYLDHAPAASAIAEMSVVAGQSGFSRTRVWVGRIPPNSRWDPAVATLTSSDPAVVPPANLRFEQADATQPYAWQVAARPSTTPGRSTVTLTLTDPDTGVQVRRSFVVTVNAAGSDFTSGDFEQGPGWGSGWPDADSWEVRERRRKSAEAVPVDHDTVMRISSGTVGVRISGLRQGTRYVVRGTAIGDGSRLRVVHNTNPTAPWFATDLAAVTVGSRTWAPTPDLTFTPNLADDPATGHDESDVWLYIHDVDPAWSTCPSDTPRCPVPRSATPCYAFVAGESCVDDLGVFPA